MKHFTQKTIIREYKNNGQHLEQLTRFTLTGRLEKADNIHGADLAQYQIKSARATVCKGDDLWQGIQDEPATEYIFALKDEVNAFIMSKQEFFEFASHFITATVESTKNGKEVKLRLKDF